jgi:molybdenum cofactor cytidylyltransferase
VIGILILAAGESRRMGQPKMLLPFDGASIIETVTRTAMQSSADEIVIVLGAFHEEIQQAVAHLPVATAFNEKYTLGMLSSIQCGIRALPPQAEAAVLLLGDQPSIPAVVIDEIIRTWKTTNQGFVLPTFEGRRGHPLLVDLRVRDELLELEPSAGMRALLSAHSEEILEVAVDISAILKDIDTPDDYSAMTGSSVPSKE